jgi:hypothetical protein
MHNCKHVSPGFVAVPVSVPQNGPTTDKLGRYVDQSIN